MTKNKELDTPEAIQKALDSFAKKIKLLPKELRAEHKVWLRKSRQRLAKMEKV